MGFNRGQGLEFTPLPLSSDADQINIDQDGNSGTPSTVGRFVYEVSSSTITRGGCAAGSLIAGRTPVDDPLDINAEISYQVE